MRKVEYWDGWDRVYGTFHEWGTGEHYKGNCYVTITMGIIEREDGKIEMIKPQDIKFLKDKVENDMLGKFKSGEVGVRVSNEIEHAYIIRLHQDILPDCDNYCDDYEEFPIMRVDADDGNCLNGYKDGYNYEFDIIDFDKLEEELER